LDYLAEVFPGQISCRILVVLIGKHPGFHFRFVEPVFDIAAEYKMGEVRFLKFNSSIADRMLFSLLSTWYP